MQKNFRYRFFTSFLIPITLSFVKAVNGAENVSKGSFVIASNHESYIDPLIVKALFDRNFGRIVFFLAKNEVYSSFFKKFFFESVGTIPVDRQKSDKNALEEAIKKARMGGVVGVFPEGTRSRDGMLQKGKTGAVRIALAAKCPILPIGINNTFELWPPNQRLPKLRREAVVNIGMPLSLEKYHNKKITKTLLREITDRLMKEIAKLSGQDYLY